MHSLLTPGSATDTEFVALPSYVMHTTIIYFRSSHQLVKNCVEIFSVAVFIRMGCQPPAACVASASFRSPALFFAQKNLPIVLDTLAR